MSEERKKSRAWIWWAILLLLVLYPLSMGPVLRIAGMAGYAKELFVIYEPIAWAIRRSPLVDDVMNRYLRHWSIAVH